MVDETKQDAPESEESKEEDAVEEVDAEAEEAEDTKEDVESTEEVDTADESEDQNTTVGDILGTKEPKSAKKEPKMVPEAVLLEYKKDNKELKNDIKDLKRLIEAGGSKKEVSQELKDIAEEHNIDPDFLEKLARSIKAQAKAEIESDIDNKMRPLAEKDKQARIDAAFNGAYDRAIKSMPAEYAQLVNKDVIKTLSLNPANASKTFPQIIEEAYGHLIKGKKTLEPVRTGVEQETEIDFVKARKDPDYFKALMADPEKKKQYNEQLLKRLQSHL